VIQKGESMEVSEKPRRDFVKKLAYVAPIVLTLRAAPSTARAGSGAEPRLRTPQRKPAEPLPGNDRK